MPVSIHCFSLRWVIIEALINLNHLWQEFHMGKLKSFFFRKNVKKYISLSKQTKINLNERNRSGRINNEHFFLSIPFAWPQELVISQFCELKFNMGVCVEVCHNKKATENSSSYCVTKSHQLSKEISIAAALTKYTNLFQKKDASKGQSIPEDLMKPLDLHHWLVPLTSLSVNREPYSIVRHKAH